VNKFDFFVLALSMYIGTMLGTKLGDFWGMRFPTFLVGIPIGLAFWCTALIAINGDFHIVWH
jgi:predicted MFS family arabinose efflux permease